MISEKSKYYSFVTKASLFFALVIAFWIPSYKFVLSYFIVAWILFEILKLNFAKRFALNFDDRFKIIVFSLQIIFFLLISSEILFAENKNIITKNIVQKLSLLIFPVFFALSGYDFKPKKHIFLKLFVLSNILMSIICLGAAFYNSVSWEGGYFTFNVINETNHNYFRESLFSLFHHRSYFSMYIVFSTAVLFYFTEKNIYFDSKAKKTIFFFLILFFAFIIFLLGSRAGILSFFILISIQIIRKIYLSGNIYLKIIAFLFIAAGIFFVFQNKRIQNTIENISFDNKQFTEKKLARPVLWIAAVDLIKENPFTGTGYEKFYPEFKQSYLKYTGKNGVLKDFRYNVHNQFLEEFVIYGISGFLILSALFLYPVFMSFKNKNYLFLAFLLISGFNFLFESMLNTIAGIVFFLFFYNYFIFVFNKQTGKKSLC